MRSNNSQSQGQKRGRNRSNNNNNRRGGSNRQAFDSNGPNVRIRGTAVQIYDKYQAMARDATSSGDRVLAESYYQWAEHYYRIANADIEQRNRRAAQAAEQQEAEAQSSDDGKGNRSDDEGAEATLITSETKDTDGERKNRNGAAHDEQDEDKPATQQVLDLANDDDVSADSDNGEDAAPEKEMRPRKTQARRRRAPRAASMNNPADLAAAVSSPDSGD